MFSALHLSDEYLFNETFIYRPRTAFHKRHQPELCKIFSDKEEVKYTKSKSYHKIDTQIQVNNKERIFSSAKKQPINLLSTSVESFTIFHVTS